jgi:hypothetical protein
VATTSGAWTAAVQTWHETRVEPLANRLVQKAELRGTIDEIADSTNAKLALYLVEDMAGAQAVEAGVGYDLTGKKMEGELFDGGQRTQGLLYGSAAFLTTTAAGLSATGLKFKLGPAADVAPNKVSLYTGARRLIDPATVTQQEAEAIYAWIRGLDEETNIATVARNTGMPEQVIRSVRQHIFFEEHTLLDGSVARFTADEGIATWWKAATEGGIPKAELERVQLLFAHEYVERSLMQSGMPYRLSETGVPMGAHELSPLVPNMQPGTPLYRPGVGPWDHTGLIP